MTQYVVDLKGGARVVAVFSARAVADRFALCALAEAFAVAGTIEEFSAVDVELLDQLLEHHDADNVEALLKKLEDTSELRRGHYSVEKALMDLFAQPEAAWPLADLITRTGAKRITVACRLTHLRKNNLLDVERGQDRRYRVRQKPAS